VRVKKKTADNDKSATAGEHKEREDGGEDGITKGTLEP